MGEAFGVRACISAGNLAIERMAKWHLGIEA